MLEYLPLLDGWTYKQYSYPSPGQIVTPGQIVPVLSKEHAVGWVVGIDFASSDSQMEFWLETDYLSSYGTPANLQAIGAVLPPPNGSYLTIYNQPNPNSTFGTYVGSILTSAYPFPWRGKVKAYASLGPLSTQPAALAQYIISVFEVTDVNAFIKSYRKLKYGRWAGMLELSGAVKAALQAIHASSADIAEALKQ